MIHGLHIKMCNWTQSNYLVVYFDVLSYCFTDIYFAGFVCLKSEICRRNDHHYTIEQQNVSKLTSFKTFLQSVKMWQHKRLIRLLLRQNVTKNTWDSPPPCSTPYSRNNAEEDNCPVLVPCIVTVMFKDHCCVIYCYSPPEICWRTLFLNHMTDI